MPLANAGNQIRMFLDIATRSFFGVAPWFFAFDLDEIAAITRAARTDHSFAHVPFGSIGLPAKTVHPRAVWVFILDGEMIVNLSVLWVGARLPAAISTGFDWMRFVEPIDHVV